MNLGRRHRYHYFILIASLLLLSGCSKGLSKSEKLTCDALFTTWQSTNLSETYNYLSLGVRELGDNSNSSAVLKENSSSADFLNTTLKSDPKSDPELNTLVSDFAQAWGKSYETGSLLMRSLIFSWKEQKPTLSDIQLELSLKTSLKMIEAGSLEIKIRNRCMDLNYSGA